MEMLPIMLATFALVATTVSSIVGIINSNTARNNLNEVMDNNRRALRPFLIIRSKEVNLVFNKSEQQHLLNWDTKEYLSIFSFKSASYIEMASISNGIAKNVSVKLEIKNLDFLINALADSNPNLIIDVSKEKDNLLYVSNEPGFGKSRAYQFDVSPKIFIAVEKGGNYKLPLPPAFIILYNLIFLHSLGLKSVEYPYLEIIIEHEDIIGTKYKHEYLFKLNSSNAKTKVNEHGTTKSATAIFDIREKNNNKKE